MESWRQQCRSQSFPYLEHSVRKLTILLLGVVYVTCHSECLLTSAFCSVAQQCFQQYWSTRTEQWASQRVTSSRTHQQPHGTAVIVIIHPCLIVAVCWQVPSSDDASENTNWKAPMATAIHKRYRCIIGIQSLALWDHNNACTSKKRSCHGHIRAAFRFCKLSCTMLASQHKKVHPRGGQWRQFSVNPNEGILKLQHMCIGYRLEIDSF